MQCRVANDDIRIISVADYNSNPRNLEDDILLLLHAMVPLLTARKAYRGRNF